MMALPDIIYNKRLRTIADKVVAGTPVTNEDLRFMLTTNDILDLGTIADYIKTSLYGNVVYYGVNMNLNYTNICELRCPLCAFSCDEEDENAFLLSLDEIETRVRHAVSMGADEIHIVGGLHPGLSLDYFMGMLKSIKGIHPGIHVVAFSAVEYDYLAQRNHMPVKDLLCKFRDAGVDAVPGGGAEIFAPRIRKKIAPKKISGKRWLEIMCEAHNIGLRTNATMLYNHIEGIDDIVDHLSCLRELQEETGGFKTFVPLRFHGENTGVTSDRTLTGYNEIRIYAASRIFLYNIPHIKGLWMYLGEKMAQVLLKFGVDDMGATYHNEKVVHAAGARTPDFGSEQFLKRIIENAHLDPVRTTASYL